MANNELKADAIKLAAPSWMKNEQKRMFRAAAGILANWGLLSEADSGIIAVYVTSLSRMIEAEKHLAEEGPVVLVKDEEGDIVKQEINQWYVISEKERKVVIAAEQQLGFSPVSRAKIVSMIKPPEEAKDDFSEYDG
ncbi:MAG: phage terminase small subunit P27 family [Bacteroidales bacterium]|nr:phage terminase small subunit P27 family [Bacteroidales bacterium]